MNSWSKTNLSLEQLMPVIREKLASGCRVTFDPKGTSMRPMLRQGVDRIVIGPVTGPLHKYDLPLYQRDNGQYVLHRIVRAGETYTCIGDNQFQYEPGVRQDQLIGVATGFYRGERFIPVNRWSHWLYCRFWHRIRSVRLLYRRGKAKIKAALRPLVKR